MDNKITLKEFFESEKKLYIRCTTFGQVKKLLKTFYKLDKKWANGISYLALTHFLGKGVDYDNKGDYKLSEDNDIEQIYVYNFSQVDFGKDGTKIITKKLCDLTLEEYELWIENNCLSCDEKCIFKKVRCGRGEYGWVNNKSFNSTRIKKKSCLDRCTLLDYLNGKNGYALHISNLNIYDKPRGLYEYGVRKAPQNMCRVYKDNHFYTLISIRPEWLCKILNGEKTVEVRKSVLKNMR